MSGQVDPDTAIGDPLRTASLAQNASSHPSCVLRAIAWPAVRTLTEGRLPGGSACLLIRLRIPLRQ